MATGGTRGSKPTTGETVAGVWGSATGKVRSLDQLPEKLVCLFVSLCEATGDPGASY